MADVGRVSGANQAYYRIHPASMQRTTYAGHLTDLEGRRAAFDSVLRSTERPVPGGRSLYVQASRALAIDALDRACTDHDEGYATPESAQDLMDFAARVWPEAASLHEWKVLQRRLRRPSGSPTTVTVTCSRIARDLNGRVRWRRWRRSGV